LGYSEKKHLKLVYKTSSDPFRIRIATIIQSQLKDIFIDVEIRSYDWGTFYGDIKNGKFQMYSLTWVGIKTPDVFRQVFHSSSLPPEGANRGRLNNKKIDQMIAAAEQEMDLQKQAGLYQVLQQELHQILPYVSLWYEDNIAFYRKNIQGYQVSHDGNYDGLSGVHRLLKKQ
jgi:peptide/nickel transport system substrate-binding protein